ncbi:hypothetical protein M408DRAFT_284466 [Serendipita vermifera MAFF 305830]|uniref:Clathrin/coatomer adaptor adaptin-like N-terminal domain-containing protein n=1 Tax=Serendipita vermifera MAFF 305830 TaxID=933852 RepID=A0A0C3ACV3_SERVB|nr:hypothetical protein M408DRAFT_284466 [Serendipita vermifera MAFF 305830]
MTVPKLVALLKNVQSHVRWIAVTTVADLAEDADNRVAIDAAIPHLVERLNESHGNGDQLVSYAAATAIAKLYTYIELRRTIESSLTSLIEKLHHSDTKIRLFAVSSLNNLTTHSESQAVASTIGSAIPYLFDLLRDSDMDVRSRVSSILVTFIPHAELNTQINDYAPLLIEQLKEPDSNMRLSAAFILKNLTEHPGPHIAIGAAIPLLIDLVNDPDYSIQYWIISALNALADNAELRSRLRAAITPLVKLLETSNSNLASDAARVLAKLASDAELRIEIADSIPSLIKLLGAPIFEPVSGATSGATLALASLAEDEDLCVKINAAILPLTEQAQDSDPHIRTAAFFAIRSLSQHVKFRAVIRHTAPLLIGLLKDPFFNASYPTTFALANLAKDVELCDTMEAAVPLLIEQLKNSNQDTAIEALSNLVEHGNPPAAICGAIPRLIEIAKYSYHNLSSVSASLLKTLAKNANFSHKFMLYVPLLIESLWEKSAHSPSAAAEIIFHLSLDAARNNLIRSTLLDFILNASSSFVADDDSLLRLTSSNHAVDVSSPVNSSNPEQTRLAESWTSTPIGTLWSLLNHKNGTKMQNGVQSLFQMAKILKEFIQPAEGVVENLVKHAPSELLPSLCMFAQHDSSRKLNRKLAKS